MQASHEQCLPSTEELVLAARKGDGDAFAGLIRRYERMLLSIAYCIVGNADSAGDVVQDAFLRAWERLGDLNEPARFPNWLCGIARNLAIDAQRKARHVRLSLDVSAIEETPLPDARSDANPLDQLERRESHERVAAALNSLDETTRPAVILRYYEGLSSKEIGQALGMSPAAVDMRLSRARQQLKRLLDPVPEVTHD